MSLLSSPTENSTAAVVSTPIASRFDGEESSATV